MKDEGEIDIRKDQIEFDDEGNIVIKDEKANEAIKKAIDEGSELPMGINLLCNCFCKD